MKIRHPSETELPLVAEHDSRSFHRDVGPVRAKYLDSPYLKPEDILVVEDRGDLIASMICFPLKVHIGGRILQMGGIGGVGVSQEYRKRSIADSMMRESFRHFKEREFFVSVLFPFSVPFYRKYGWEVASRTHSYVIDVSGIPLYDERSSVRRFEPGDFDKIIECYSDVARTMNGSLARWREYWEHKVFAPDHPQGRYISVYESGARIEGYLIYEYRGGHDGSRHELIVREKIAKSESVERGLWGFLASQDDQIDKIHIRCPAYESVLERLIQPRGQHSIIPTFMARIVSLPKAVSTRDAYNDVTGVVGIEVKDGFVPENNGVFRFELYDGKCNVEEVVEVASDVETDIQTFSQIFWGYLTASKAAQLSKLRGSAEAISLLDEAFALPMPYILELDAF